MLPLLTVTLLSFAPGLQPQHRLMPLCRMQEAAPEPAPEPVPPVEDAAAVAAATKKREFDLRAATAQQRTDGAGFNQFDPLLSASRFISRRFGLAGGLGFVALLAAVEGNEIVKGILGTATEEGSGETITKPSGLQYVDLIISKSGDAPRPGAVIGFNAKVSIGDQTLFDSTVGPDAKPIAFKYGQRPFQNVVCEGVEEGLQGMKPGSKRTLFVPKELGPPGVNVPKGVTLRYDIELLEVLPGYF